MIDKQTSEELLQWQEQAEKCVKDFKANFAKKATRMALKGQKSKFPKFDVVRWAELWESIMKNVKEQFRKFSKRIE